MCRYLALQLDNSGFGFNCCEVITSGLHKVGEIITYNGERLRIVRVEGGAYNKGKEEL